MIINSKAFLSNFFLIFHYVNRFKDGSGDPAGFKDMLHRHNLPVGTFVRYVGNRMHVLFHLAGILVLHCNKVKDFLDTRCTAGKWIQTFSKFTFFNNRQNGKFDIGK